MREATPEAVFAARLRDTRKAADMSQAQLAALISEQHGIQLDPMTVLRMEKGRRRITLNEAAAIADVLKIRLFDLIRPEPLPRLDRAAAEELVLRLRKELEELDTKRTGAESDAGDAHAAARAADARVLRLTGRRTEIATVLKEVLAELGEDAPAEDGKP